MPTVGETQFDYTDEGMAAAQQEAEASGQDVVMSDTPSSYMGDMDARLEQATDLLSRAEEEDMDIDAEDSEDSEDQTTDTRSAEVVESIFQYMNNRIPNMDDPKDVAEVELIRSSITPEMVEDLQNQEISIVDAVLQVHRSRDLERATAEPQEEETPKYFS